MIKRHLTFHPQKWWVANRWNFYFGWTILLTQVTYWGQNSRYLSCYYDQELIQFQSFQNFDPSLDPVFWHTTKYHVRSSRELRDQPTISWSKQEPAVSGTSNNLRLLPTSHGLLQFHLVPCWSQRGWSLCPAVLPFYFHQRHPRQQLVSLLGTPSSLGENKSYCTTWCFYGISWLKCVTDYVFKYWVRKVKWFDSKDPFIPSLQRSVLEKLFLKRKSELWA